MTIPTAFSLRTLRPSTRRRARNGLVTVLLALIGLQPVSITAAAVHSRQHTGASHTRLNTAPKSVGKSPQSLADRLSSFVSETLGFGESKPAIDPSLVFDPLGSEQEALGVKRAYDAERAKRSPLAGLHSSGVALLEPEPEPVAPEALAAPDAQAAPTLAADAPRVAAASSPFTGAFPGSVPVVRASARFALPVDSQAPTITITEPATNAVTYFPSIEVRGTAEDLGADATGITHVYVNGHEASYDTETKEWVATGIAVVEGPNRIVAEAEDGATPANVGQAEINVVRNVGAAPSLTIRTPTPGQIVGQSAITVAGSVSTGSANVAVTVTVNGQAATVAGGEFTRSIDLTNLIDPATHAGTITVVATDSLNQTAQQSVTIIGDFGSDAAPAVAFSSVPTSVNAGGSYAVEVQASDNVGVAGVTFLVDGQEVSTLTAPPYQFPFTVAVGAVAGSTITLAAIATDLSGRSATATASTRVEGAGGVSGYVFDDRTGYPVGQATAAIGSSAATTGADGAYSVSTLQLGGVSRITKAGYTPVERSYAVATGGGTALFDARVTPIDAQVNAIAANGGTATGDGGRISVQFAAGSFPAGTDVRLTAVGPQGLIALLPFGWSPVPGGVVDVRPAAGGVATGVFPTLAALSFSSAPGMAANVPLVLARYDEQAHVWRVIDAGLISTEGALPNVFIPGPGQYAFVVADQGATAPPAAVEGEALGASAEASPTALDAATAVAVPSPRAALMSVEARSIVGVVATSATKLPSGLWVEVSFDETYTPLNGSPSIAHGRTAQDFVLYAFPAATATAPNRLGCEIVAKPQRTDLILGAAGTGALRQVDMHVEVRSGRPGSGGTLIGAGGGTATSDEGATLEIGEGALGADTPVFVETVADTATGLTLPTGYEILGAVDVELSGAGLATSGVLTAPARSGATDRIVVARVISVEGRRAPKVVGRGEVSGGTIRSTTEGPAGVPFDGVRESGLYVFLRIGSAFGYAKGVVRTPALEPAGLARVEGARTPFVDVTGEAGTYLTIGAAGAGTAGANALEAASLVTDATGQATAQLAGQDAVADIEIVLVASPLSVVAITPGDGQQSVSVSTPVAVTFSKPVNAATVTGSTLRLAAGASPVGGTIVVAAGGRSAIFTPSQALTGSTVYTVTVGAAIRDIYGASLAADATSTFTTAASIPVDNRLKPENVKIGYPDESGYVTVTIAAGAAPVGSIIVLVNKQTGATVTITAQDGQMAIRILASVGDEIEILVHQPDGVEYKVSQGAYVNAETGFTTVGPNGGAVSNDAGMVLSVPKNAIVGMAEIKLTPLAEADTAPIEIPNVEYGTDVKFGAAVRIDTSGNFSVERELHIDLPAPPGAIPDSKAVLVRQASMTVGDDPIEYWELVTSARVENDRLKSNSPPFTGLAFLDGQNVVMMLLPTFGRVITGYVGEPDPDNPDEPCLPGTTCRPVRNALCRFGPADGVIAHRIAARTNASGLYAMVDMSVQAQDNLGGGVTAFDEATGRIGFAPVGGAGNAESQWLNGMIHFDGPYRCDIGLDARPDPGATAPQVSLAVDAIQPQDQESLATFGVVPVGAPMYVDVTVDRGIGALDASVRVGGAISQTLAFEQLNNRNFRAYFTAALQGSYEVIVHATTTGYVGDPSRTTTASFNFVASPSYNPGVSDPAVPPYVLTPTVAPPDGALGVDAQSSISLSFNEPVLGLVPGDTVVLEDIQTQQVVQGTLLSGATIVHPTTQVSKVEFKPTQALDADHSYRIRVTSAVVDTTGTHFDQVFEPDPQTGVDPVSDAFSSEFTVFGGAKLTDHPVPSAAERIAFVGQYAVTIQNSGNETSYLSIYDLSTPDHPVEIVPENGQRFRLPQKAMALDVTATGCLAETPDGDVCSRFAVVTTYSPFTPTKAANLWVINLTDIRNPQFLAVTSLYFPAELPGVPLTVKIKDWRAYVGVHANRGVLVVDINRAMQAWADALDQHPTPPTVGAIPWPLIQATHVDIGFGWTAVVQRVSWNRTSPASASTVADLDVLEQNVIGGYIQGVMPVAYVADPGGGGRLVAVGLSSSTDGQVVDIPNDLRLLNWDDQQNPPVPPSTPVGAPSQIQTERGIRVAGEIRDIAVLTNGVRMWIYDVSNAYAPVQFPSVSFADLGLTGVARRFVLEGTLMYVAIGNKVAVLDIADPAHVKVVSVISGLSGANGVYDIGVHDGFIYTLDPTATDPEAGMNVAIASPAALILAHGKTDSTNQLCANPVLVSRATPVHLLQDAEIYYKIYGVNGRSTGADQILIRKGEEIVAQFDSSRLSTPNGQSIEGTGVWTTSDAATIDRGQIYTVQIVSGPFASKREPIPFATLIDQYQKKVEVAAIGGVTRTAKYSYAISADSSVSMSISSASGFSGIRRAGIRVEDLDASTLTPGSYPFTLSAQTTGSPLVTDTVTGNLVVVATGESSYDMGDVYVSGVNLGSGRINFAATDSCSASLSPEASHSIMYDSGEGLSGESGSLAPGWNDSNRYSLSKSSDTISMVDPGGGTIEFDLDAANGSSIINAEGSSTSVLHKNNDGSYDVETRGKTKYHFDASLDVDDADYFDQASLGNLSSIVDANGNTTSIERADDGRVQRVVDGSGRAFVYDYELVPSSVNDDFDFRASTTIEFPCFERGQFVRFNTCPTYRWRLKKITSDDKEVEYLYTPDGDLGQVVSRGGECSTGGLNAYSFEYTAEEQGAPPTINTAHLLTAINDPNGKKTVIKYDFSQPTAPVREVRRGEGSEEIVNTYTYQRDPQDNSVTQAIVTDGNGHSWTYGYQNGLVHSVHGPRDATWAFQYNVRRQVTSSIDPEGVESFFEYDARGNRTTVGRRGGGIETRVTTEYDPALNLPIRSTDANGNVTVYGLNTQARAISSVTLAEGSVDRMTFYPNGKTHTQTNAHGFTTTYEYDNRGNTTRIAKQTGVGPDVISQYEYNDAGQMKKSFGTLEPTIEYCYDEKGRMVWAKSTDPTGIRDPFIVEYTYFPGGQVKTQTTRALAGPTQQLVKAYTYDSLDRLQTTTETFDGHTYTTTRSYDKNSNVVSVVDSRGVTTTFEYDDLNYLIRRSFSGPHGAPVVESYTVDLAGNITSSTDRYGQTISVGFDGIKRATTVTYPGGYVEETSYDLNGNITGFRDRNGNLSTTRYDRQDRPVQTTDPLGRTVRWTYDDEAGVIRTEAQPSGLRTESYTDGLGRLIKQRRMFGSTNYETTVAYLDANHTTEITDPRGTVVRKTLSVFGSEGEVVIDPTGLNISASSTYSGLGGLRSSRDANGNETTIVLDGRNRATSIQYPEGVNESFEFDSANNMVSHTDKRGVVSTMTYDNINRPLTTSVQATPTPITVSTSYDDANRTVTVTDAEGHATVTAFDGLRRVTAVTNARNDTRFLTYDGVNLVAESDFKDPSNLTRYQYDDVDRLIAVYDRTGALSTIAYNDANGSTVTTTDRRGDVSVQFADPLGRIVNQTSGGLPAGSVAYDGANNVVSVTDALGNQTQFVFDRANRVSEIHSPGNIQNRSITYDGVGNVLSESDGFGNPRVMTYDGLNRLRTSTIDPGNGQSAIATTYEYDGGGLLKRIVDGRQNATRYDYNELGSLVRVTDAANKEWTFGYDRNQVLRTVSDPLSRTVTYVPDELNRTHEIHQPLGLVTTIDYDANGNTIRRVDPKGQIATTTFDTLDRPQSLTYSNTPGVGPRSYGFQYDVEGNPTAISETLETGQGITTRSYGYTYDARNRLVTSTDPYQRRVTYGYDAANNIRSFTDAADRQTSYSYDPLNRLSDVTLPGGDHVGYEWTPNGLPQRTTYVNGMKREFGYDLADRLTSIHNTVGASTETYEYEYDSGSNRTVERRLLDGQLERSVGFAYDSLNRLTSAGYTSNGTTRTVGYEYDAVGNRTREFGVLPTGQALDRQYAYDALNRLGSIAGDPSGAIGFTYDNNGNLVSQTRGGETTTYEYDVRDQLRRVVGSGGQTVVAMDYDAGRRRLAKTVPNGTTLSFVYNGDSVVAEYGATGQLVSTYDYGADLVRANLAGSEQWYFTDGMNSVSALGVVNGTEAAISGRYEYDAWGEQISAPTESLNRRGYTGQYRDEETGMLALGNGERYYLPEIGRFIQQDTVTGSIDQAQSMNRYAYGMGNPMKYWDPSGNTCESLTGDQMNWRQYYDSLGWVSLADRVAPPPAPEWAPRDDSKLSLVERFLYGDSFVRAVHSVLGPPTDKSAGEIAWDLVDGLLSGGNITKMCDDQAAYRKGEISAEQYAQRWRAHATKAAWNFGFTVLETIAVVGSGGTAGAVIGAAGAEARLLGDDFISSLAGLDAEQHSQGEYQVAVALGAVFGALGGGAKTRAPGTAAGDVLVEDAVAAGSRRGNLLGLDDIARELSSTEGRAPVAAFERATARSAAKAEVSSTLEAEVAAVARNAGRGGARSRVDGFGYPQTFGRGSAVKKGLVGIDHETNLTTWGKQIASPAQRAMLEEAVQVFRPNYKLLEATEFFVANRLETPKSVVGGYTFFRGYRNLASKVWVTPVDAPDLISVIDEAGHIAGYTWHEPLYQQLVDNEEVQERFVRFLHKYAPSRDAVIQYLEALLEQNDLAEQGLLDAY